MIINNNESQIEVIGDIQEFKTGIDPKNLELITTLLSSNLYSAPERSFIREIVSNAWDSQVEAGTTETPVLIKIGGDYITIRDFGTGLSPERFKDVYCNIGSSTKRESNDYIGGFGIGKFSSLAVSDTVEITSYYEGKAYYYIMLKDGNHITNNLVLVTDTKEKNGVEVTVRNIKRINKYIEALSYITFFPNVYVDSSIYGATDINSVKIKNYKTFACASSKTYHKLLLGNVLYPLDCGSVNLPDEDLIFIRKIDNTGIAIKFNIGEVEVTPNRESIIYSDKTINLIKERIAEARKEVYSYIIKYNTKDYDDLLSLDRSMNGSKRFSFITLEEDNSFFNFMYYPTDLDEGLATYKGRKLSKEDLSNIHTLLQLYSPWTRAFVEDKIYTDINKLPYRLKSYTSFKNTKILMVSSTQRLSSNIKLFLRDTYYNYVIYNEFTLKEFTEFVYDVFKPTMPIWNDEFTLIVQDLYNYINSNAIHIDFNTNPEYLKFKEVYKSAPKLPLIKNVRLYVRTYRYDCVNKITHVFTTLEEAVKFIKRLKCGVVLDNIGPTNEFLSSTICPRGFSYITASIPIIEELRKIPFSNVVDKDKVLYHDRIITKLACILKYNLDRNISASILYTLPEDFGNIINGINSVLLRYKRLIPYAQTIKDKVEDSYYKGVADKVDYYIKAYNEILDTFCEGSITSKDVITALLIKTKSYRVGKEAYNSYKNNKILKFLKDGKSN